MKLVIQRVKQAEVKVDGSQIGHIGQGLLVLLGVGKGDTRDMVDKYVDKLIKLRIFADEDGKTNLSVADIQGEIMVVSQFTLYADCKKGNRPSFVYAAEPALAEELYEYFKDKVKERYGSVACGEFGAGMEVSLQNDGPFTIVWDSRDW
ncbi:MAG: D-aminoacyl-tRNA deacylase [Clostridium sp.]|nr:D-aminoacyl-tRNA deacylase [Clostridium sp.]MCM1398230.1 D-aminoacyl-tRNA deacylase [Clostridium sp.]MCM1460356.1 D-aminoacyl-tRNA deacylase [Bacteroides sp.]